MTLPESLSESLPESGEESGMRAHPSPSVASNLSIQDMKNMLAQMWIIRRFEEKCGEIYTAGKIAGFCHLCIGQEAISVGASHAMGPKDTMITAYRSHGHALARGLTPFQVMAELMGKEGGSSKGKGGSMHLFHTERLFYGGHGIVGAQTALGTGLAFAHQYSNDGGVCMTFLGDGASNQGQFFESMNMASLWNLPVLYIIENNGYSMGTAVSRACSGGPLHQRGMPFGIPGSLVKGDDVLHLYDVFTTMLETIRTTSRPMLLEIDTYRFKGHSMSDPGKYRTRKELDEARSSRDPLLVLSNYLKERGESDEDLAQFDHQAKDIAEHAFAMADAAPEPSTTSLWEDILR
jgi:pyruvate dehydrogenase E1 component alpha subunit